MKIGNSKKQLAKIIHENGGWKCLGGPDAFQPIGDFSETHNKGA